MLYINWWSWNVSEMVKHKKWLFTHRIHMSPKEKKIRLLTFFVFFNFKQSVLVLLSPNLKENSWKNLNRCRSKASYRLVLLPLLHCSLLKMNSFFLELFIVATLLFDIYKSASIPKVTEVALARQLGTVGIEIKFNFIIDIINSDFDPTTDCQYLWDLTALNETRVFGDGYNCTYYHRNRELCMQ